DAFSLQSRHRDFSDFQPDIFGLAGGGRRIAIGTEQDEFFAAVSGDEITCSAVSAEQCSEDDEHLVASLMAKCVVDFLKVVDIAHDQAAGQPLIEMRVDA